MIAPKKIALAFSLTGVMLSGLTSEAIASTGEQSQTIRLNQAVPDGQSAEPNDTDLEAEFEELEQVINWLEDDGLGFHTTFSIGYQGSNLQALNQALNKQGYSSLSEHALSFGGAMQFRVFHVLSEFEGQVNLLTPTLNSNYSLQATSGLFFINLGYVFRPLRNLNIYPLVGIGAAMLDLNFTQRNTALSFDDFLKNPGRQGDLNNMMLAFNLGLGIDWLGDWFGLIGLRAGYIFTPWGSNWWTINQIGSDNSDSSNYGYPISNGPTLGLAGPYLRLNLGF